MKPILRWTMGSSNPIDLEILELSIKNIKKHYQDTFDYYICHNNIDAKLLRIFDVNLVEQKPIPGMYQPKGVAWKLYPPRLSIQTHEIFMDSDVVLWKKLEEIDKFLNNKDLFLFTEALFYNHGRFKTNIKLNSGIIGIPPNFDFQQALVKNMQDGVGWHNYFDEQGMVATIFSNKPYVVIPMSKVGICHYDTMPKSTHGLHFVSAKRKQSWSAFKEQSKVKPCWILCNPRSGSSILCDLLNFTNKFPICDHPNVREKRGPLEQGTAFNEWLRLYETANDFEKHPVPFLKLLHHQYVEIFGNKGAAYFEKFLPGLKLIVLHRRNKTEQIISQYFAETTNTYHIYDKEALKSYLQKKIEYNSQRLKNCINKIKSYNAIWEEFIGDRDILNVYYEDMLKSPKTTLRQVLSFCEINYSDDDLDRAVDEAITSKPRILKMTRLEQTEWKEIVRQNNKQPVKNKIFGTHPILFHAQGRIEKSPLWDKISNIKYIPLEDCPDLDITTWNNQNPHQFLKRNGKTLGIFENSLQSLKHTVLGKNIIQWTNRAKINATLQHLKNSESTYTLGADSSDVVILGEPLEAVSRFLKMDCELLFNAELNFWPPDFDPKIKKFEETQTSSKFKYLNGGMWIGHTKFCIEFFEAANQLAQGEGSEQVILKQMYKKFHPKVKLDHMCQIFQVLNSIPNQMLTTDNKMLML